MSEGRGSLKMWEKFRYQRKWFKIQPDSVIEYFNEEKGLSDNGQSVERMILSESILVDTDGDGEKTRFTLTDPKNNIVWYLKAAVSSDIRVSWFYCLELNGVRKMSVAEYNQFLSYGELVPSLNFPTVNGDHALRLKGEEKEILDKSNSIIVSAVENVVKVGVTLVPGGHFVTLAAEGVVTGGSKIYQFLHRTNIKELEKHLEKKIEKEVFRSDFLRFQAEISATERRYKMMMDDELTQAQKEIEVTTAMHSFEIILRLFHSPGNSFLENAFTMSPYIASFSTLYLLFAQMAIHVHPAYTNSILEGVNVLENCLHLYADTAIEQRLNAIKFVSSRLSRYNHVIDEKYPSKRDGIQIQFAYVDYKHYPDGQQFFEDYKESVRTLYAQYFDETINKFSTNKSKLLEINKFSTNKSKLLESAHLKSFHYNRKSCSLKET